jgi:cytochrome c oxidase cbb3-type subunit III
MNARTLMALPFATLVLSSCRQCAATSTASAAAPPPAIAYEAHVAAGGRVPPGGTLHNAHQGDKAVVAAGAQLFTAMNCDGCHGPGATGSVGPNLGVGRWRYGGADAEVFMSIFYGRPKSMPAFGGVLGEEGVWTLVTYIRSLPRADNLATESWEKP